MCDVTVPLGEIPSGPVTPNQGSPLKDWEGLTTAGFFTIPQPTSGHSPSDPVSLTLSVNNAFATIFAMRSPCLRGTAPEELHASPCLFAT